MADLAILQADAREAARLTGALGGEHGVTVFSTWTALRTALEEGTLDGCLVDAEHPTREEAMREIASLRSHWRGLAIIACAHGRGGQGYFDLGEAGVDGVLAAGPTNKTRVRAVIDEALATARGERIARDLRGRYPAPAPDAIGWAIENAGSETTVEKLASALGHTPRSLRQALHEARFPGPTRVLLWGRLLLAGARLARDKRTVEDVAFSLGYSASTSLARAMKTHTGLTPREVSERGGMERVRDVLFPTKVGGSGGRAHPGKVALLVAAAFLSAGCASLGRGGARVDRDAIDAILDRDPVSRAHVGVLAVDAGTGRTLYSRNANRWFVPASNQKILLSAAAWSLLGPEYRFRTELWATGPFATDHLDGDLVLIASGDPSLSSRYWENDTLALDALADSLRANGPAHVTGSLVIDASTWDSTSVAPTREVADLEYGYGATGGPFAIAEGEIEVVVRAGPTVGSPAEVSWSPALTEGYVLADVLTAEADLRTRVDSRYLPESRQLQITGHVPLGVTDTLSFAQRDAVRQAAAALSRALDAKGIITEAGWAVEWTPGAPIGPCFAGTVRECPGARRIAVMESPPLSDLVAGVLGPSQNWMTEQLTLTLGSEFRGLGSWDDGIEVLERFLSEYVGVDPLDVAARDGSGLSAYNLVTPRALVSVLQFMDARDDAAHFRAAMAEPGETDSTLEERLPGLEGRVFAKTGTISNVNSLSGYLVRTDGSRVTFSILSNGSGLSPEEMRDVIDDVVRVLAR